MNTNDDHSRQGIRVLFFLPQLGGGGAEMHVVRLVNSLSETRILPSIALARGPGPFAEKLLHGTETVLLAPRIHFSSTLGLVFSFIPLVRLIDRLKPDVLCPVLVLPSVIGILAARASKHSPKVVPNIQSSLFPTRSRKHYVDGLLRVIVPRVFKLANGIIALSRGVGTEISDLIPELKSRIHVVNNIGLPEMKAVTTQNGEVVKSSRFRFLACGRLVEAKGYPEMIDAFAILAGKYTNCELIILGEGPQRAGLTQQITSLGLQDRIRLIGFVDNPQDYMRNADAFVLTSRWEGFGNVIVEAMATGLPVVATRCPHGPEEIITHERNGILVEPGNKQAICDGMQRVMTDRELRTSLINAGRIRARDFSADRIRDQYVRVLKNLIGSQPTGEVV